MGAERKSLASFFGIDKFAHNENIYKDISQHIAHYYAPQSWWYVTQVSQFSYHDKNLSEKKIGSVRFNETNRNIIMSFMYGFSTYEWNRVEGEKWKKIKSEKLDLEELLQESNQPRKVLQPTLEEKAWKDRIKHHQFVCSEEFIIARWMIYPSCVAYVWNRKEGKEIPPLKHTATVNSIEYNENGIELITASDDCTMCLWHGVTGKQLFCMTYKEPVASAVFNAQGTELVVATNAGNIQVLAKYQTNNLSQLLLKDLLDIWMLVEKPSKEIKSSKELLGTVAAVLRCNADELRKTWKSLPKNVRDALKLSMISKIQRYGK